MECMTEANVHIIACLSFQQQSCPQTLRDRAVVSSTTTSRLLLAHPRAGQSASQQWDKARRQRHLTPVSLDHPHPKTLPPPIATPDPRPFSHIRHSPGPAAVLCASLPRLHRPDVARASTTSTRHSATARLPPLPTRCTARPLHHSATHEFLIRLSTVAVASDCLWCCDAAVKPLKRRGRASREKCP
ncbi:hypothetical protein SNOG_00852 [Parastagonospora nodorum SN15]|uniref:Uncharacterized protein n=1 Tax=Phaeosphaeria nodorum (strain SN15 / ATCC MYA-4574 / FGSC 10173) TaxID=321614 RepID=Q0V562_PHANO|nr:hypothetical protein SNOG_00852 [Parastagonospora nodorum SN15]EAT92347.1 hypothetical protein SNOG_00852 [Parastagonospora nodorum SN15]